MYYKLGMMCLYMCTIVCIYIYMYIIPRIHSTIDTCILTRLYCYLYTHVYCYYPIPIVYTFRPSIWIVILAVWEDRLVVGHMTYLIWLYHLFFCCLSFFQESKFCSFAQSDDRNQLKPLIFQTRNHHFVCGFFPLKPIIYRITGNVSHYKYDSVRDFRIKPS